MANSEKIAEAFDKELFKVLKELDKRVLDIVAGSKISQDVYDAAALLNSRASMIEALRLSGYSQLVEAYVATYPDVAKDVKRMFKVRGLPDPKFSTADVELFSTISAADLEAFNLIGVRAMDELRFGLHRGAVSSAPFSDMVKMVRDATVGTSVKGSPLKNYAYTYANSAHQGFSGEVAIAAGEAIGADTFKVQGPVDGVTRDECLAAMNDRVRTKEEWQAAGYWGGLPGGWNCRHWFIAVFSDD